MPEPITSRPDSGTEVATDSYAPPGGPATIPAAAADRYVVGDVIARGGMGAVRRARDTHLDRDVAVKLLLDKYPADSAVARRFVEEARITGQLQHPGIPPVYDLGTLPGGRPYLAMKLINGRTLADMLRDDGPNFPTLLPVFEAICQAVGYAHAHGVIHRDLKPANVMVGSFGEVQVMDWGLAKVLASRERERPEDPAATATAIRAPRDAADDTQAGSALGTPAYMPPEQAAGAVERIDQRSDVFSLGGVLCALLTGQPPYVADTVRGTVVMAGLADTAAALARLDGCGADPDLIALAKRCLAGKPADRPADANAVADAVAGLRRAADERARRAEIDKAAAEVRTAEERRRRRTVLAAAAAVAAVLAAGVAVSVWEAVRATTAEHDADLRTIEVAAERDRTAAALRDTAAERDAKEAARKDAVAARDTARGRFQLALDGFNALVFGIQRKLEDRPGTGELRKELLAAAQAGLKKLLAAAEADRGGADSTVVWAHLQMGDVSLLLGDTATAKAEYDAGFELARKLAADDPKSVQAQRDLSISFERLGDVHLKVGNTPAAVEAYEDGLAISRKLAAADPTSTLAQRDLSVSFDRLGDVYLKLGDTPAALNAYEDGLAISRKLAAADPTGAQAQRDLSVSFDKLGGVHLKARNTPAALAAFEDGLAIRRTLAAADPTSALAQRDLSVSFDRLGGVHLELGHTPAAVKAFEDGLAIRRTLAAADPTSALAQRDLSVSHNKLGDVHLEAGSTRAALAAYEDGLAISRKLAAADPTSALAQRDLSVSHNKLGDVHLELGHTPAALAAFEDALAIRRKLAAADPTSAQAQRDLSISHNKLGEVHLKLDNARAALAAFEDGLAISRTLAAADPTSALAQRDLSVSFDKLGEVHLKLDDARAALAAFEDGLAISRTLAAADPTSALAQRDLLVSFYKLGAVCETQRDFTAAAGWYEKAIAVAAGFERPAFFEKQLAFLRIRRAACRTAAAAPPREPAPAPRPAR